MIIFGRLPPQFPQTSFKKLKYHSPLEGESQKPSPQAKADAVGGQRGASERQRRMAKADAVGKRIGDVVELLE